MKRAKPALQLGVKALLLTSVLAALVLTSVACSQLGGRGGGTLTRLWSDPPTLDPHFTTDVNSAVIVVEIFEGLVAVDLNLDIVPNLAERWDISSDGAVYTFYLREDAAFHDGRPVTAQDFKWSIERAANPSTESPTASQYLGDIAGVAERLNGEAETVGGVRVIDEHTLEIAIDAPKSYFMSKLTFPSAFVLDRENVTSNGTAPWFHEPNGTGPFKLDKYVPGAELVLAGNDAYHLGAPRLDSVRFVISAAPPLSFYQDDEIHITEVDNEELAQASAPSSPLRSELVQAPPPFSISYVGMNVKSPPFDDPRVRQALDLAIDTNAFSSDSGERLTAPAKGILPPGLPGFSEEVQGLGFDPERARQLLAESRYGPGLEKLDGPIKLHTVQRFGSDYLWHLDDILEMWRANLGIEVEPVIHEDWATYLDDVLNLQFGMFRLGWFADYPDPENFLDLLFHSESGINWTGYSNPQVDALLEEARSEPDRERRFELYHQAERTILNETPWALLWNRGGQYVLVKPNVHDYHLTQLILPKLRFVYISE